MSKPKRPTPAIKRLNQHSTAYAKWKTQTQDTFEFAVLVCTAVPTLKRNLKLYEKGIIDALQPADHYGPRTEPTQEQNDRSLPLLQKKAVGYKEKLSKYILISNFSFFESYVVDVVGEMISFHGGSEAFAATASSRANKVFGPQPAKVEDAYRKLRGSQAEKNKGRAKIATATISQSDFAFPTDLFASYGIASFARSLGNMFAKDIPGILRDALQMPLSDEEILSFHNIREARNNIAHGNPQNLDLTKVTDMCMFLRSIALRLDQHILRYYMISETQRIG